MSGTLKVGGKTLATHDTNTNVAKIQLGSTSDVVFTDSAGNNVLSESGSVVTLSTDNIIIDNAGKISSVGQIELQVDTDNNQSGTYIGFSRNNTTSERLALFEENGDVSFYEDTGTTAKFFWDASAESLGIGTSPAVALHIVNSDATFRLEDADTSNKTDIYQIGGGGLGISDGTTERIRIDSSGNLLLGKTSVSQSTVGTQMLADGPTEITTDGDRGILINRKTSDGQLIAFDQDGVTEGQISVLGSDVSYLGGNLARWSQLPDSSKNETIVKGTVMTNLDAMCEWSHPDEYWTEEDEIPVDEEGNPTAAVGDLKKAAFVEDNEQLNRMVVSSVEGDPNVAGIFVSWDDDDDQFNDMIVAMTGDLVIRIAQGVTVARGDLLMSAGDGTAKPQGDDIVRSKTIAKVTSTYVSHTYEDGSYLVPCVLMAC